MTEDQDSYTRLIALLDENHADYHLIDHDSEGQTEAVSMLRGNNLSEAAKCIIVMVKIGKKQKQFVLAVIPGDKRVNLNAIKALYSGTYVSFASTDIAEQLAGSVSGTVLPFSFSPELELIVDPSLLANETIYFNAARLDRSLGLKTKYYISITQPRTEKIIED